MMKQHRRLTGGFSLLETTVAAFLIVLALVFVINVFPIMRKGLVLSENRTRAANLGQALLNQARLTPFDELAACSGCWNHGGISDSRTFDQRIDYTLQVTPRHADLKWLTVALSWTDAAGNHRLTVETQRTRR